MNIILIEIKFAYILSAYSVIRGLKFSLHFLRQVENIIGASALAYNEAGFVHFC